MVKKTFSFLKFLMIVFLLNLCRSSITCKFFFSYFLILCLVFVSKNGTTNADGSEANPFPNITNAIDSANDSEITLILFFSKVPYEFFEAFYSNLNLNIM